MIRIAAAFVCEEEKWVSDTAGLCTGVGRAAGPAFVFFPLIVPLKFVSTLDLFPAAFLSDERAKGLCCFVGQIEDQPQQRVKGVRPRYQYLFGRPDVGGSRRGGGGYWNIQGSWDCGYSGMPVKIRRQVG